MLQKQSAGRGPAGRGPAGWVSCSAAPLCTAALKCSGSVWTAGLLVPARGAKSSGALYIGPTRDGDDCYRSQCMRTMRLNQNTI